MTKGKNSAGSRGSGAGEAAGELLVKGGTVYTASDTFRADILARGGTIVQIAGAIEPPPDAEVVDAAGLEVYPGGVDVHTHFDLPFMGSVSADDFESGTRAAAVGGTTTIVDFVIPEKGKSVIDAVEKWHGKAAGKCAVDYGFHVALVDFNDRVASEIHEIVGEGITSFKCFLAYKGALMIDDAQLLGVLETAREHGALVSIHAENGDVLDYLAAGLLRDRKTGPQYHAVAHPDVAEGEAVHRAAALARLVGAPLYIVHMSCTEALEEVRAARDMGQLLLAETCPQYLLLDDSLYRRKGFEPAKWVMSPPLRDVANQEELWCGLRDGYVQAVATDHCSFNFAGQKEMGKESFAKIPNGIPGVGDRMALLYTYGVGKGRITKNQFAAVTATNPARIFGLSPAKGTIGVGSDADLVLIDPARKGKVAKETSHHRVDYSAFEGMALEGLPAVVIARGAVVARDNTFLGAGDRGRYLRRARFDPAAWGFPR
jgi:dihydropyrimidinase